MTPERALEHDERCERCPELMALLCGYCQIVRNECDHRDLWEAALNETCCCAERALAVARQREEEAKGRFAQCEASWHQLDAACQVRFDEYRAEVRQKSDMIAALTESNTALRAENDRLTLAASKSARTLQVEIALLRKELFDEQTQRVEAENGESALQAQVTALREAIGKCSLVALARWLRSRAAIWDPDDPPALVRLADDLDALDTLAAIPQDGA